jgi:hypothetical protein
VRRDLVSALRSLGLPTLAVLFVAAFASKWLGVAVRIYALLLCAVALVLVLSALRRAFPPAAPLRSTARRPHRTQHPASLSRLEQLSILGVAGAFDLHHRLRPRLRAIAQGVLATRRRVSLDAEPAAARAALGDATYELLRPDRLPPEDRLARGVPVADLRRVVESLERV